MKHPNTCRSQHKWHAFLKMSKILFSDSYIGCQRYQSHCDPKQQPFFANQSVELILDFLKLTMTRHIGVQYIGVERVGNFDTRSGMALEEKTDTGRHRVGFA